MIDHDAATREPEGQRGYWFQLGYERGRFDALRDVREALGLPDAITHAVVHHEATYHAD